MAGSGYEIERKFLIAYPDLAWLSRAAERTEITQTYLLDDGSGFSERVRRRGRDGAFTYTHTRKKKLNARRRIELEEEISREDYERLLRRADPARRTIEKTRYCLPANGKILEIDVFPFWHKQAFLEIELNDEAESFLWPEKLCCLREITEDRRYTNAALALSIPSEDSEGE